jgi:ABC-type transporter Mla MlaB component
MINRVGNEIDLIGKVDLENLSVYCDEIDGVMVSNDNVSIKMEALIPSGSSILALIIHIKRKEKELNANVVFHDCPKNIYGMIRLSGLEDFICFAL